MLNNIQKKFCTTDVYSEIKKEISATFNVHK